MPRERTTVSLTPTAMKWLKKNDWFNASYELEKVIRNEMRLEE